MCISSLFAEFPLQMPTPQSVRSPAREMRERRRRQPPLRIRPTELRPAVCHCLSSPCPGGQGIALPQKLSLNIIYKNGMYINHVEFLNLVVTLIPVLVSASRKGTGVETRASPRCLNARNSFSLSVQAEQGEFNGNYSLKTACCHSDIF